MTTRDRDELEQDIRQLFDPPPGAVDRAVEGALARPAPSGSTRKLSAAAAALILAGAALTLWLQPQWSRHATADSELRVFQVGDLTVAVDEDGTSWVEGPGPAPAEEDHFDLIIVEELEP